MAPKLNQIIAVEQSVKSRAHSEISETYKILQKPALWAGLSRTYVPTTEGGEELPPETTRVQASAAEVLRRVAASKRELFDTVATKDWANCSARANVVVDGITLLEDVPVTYLLFLEKELTDLHTFVKTIPVLDPAEAWTYDPNSDLYATSVLEKVRTKKVPRTLVKYEATEQHPAQVEVWHEDVPVGRWREVKFSGALPAQRVNELLGRVERLLAAVKFAREEANAVTVEQRKVGEKVFAHLFA